MAKEIVRIMLDFGEGPIWTKYYDESTNRLLTGIDVVDNDDELWILNGKIQDLYSSFYKINYKDEPVYFDKEQEKADKEKMLVMLEKLKNRLKEINDGSFEIDDRETERVRNL